MLRKDKWKKKMTMKKRLKKREAEDEEKCAIFSNRQWKNQNHMIMSGQLMQTYKRPSYMYKNKHSKMKASTAADE